MGRLSKKDMEELREACSYDCGYTDTEEVVKDITAQVLEELDSDTTYGDEVGLVDSDRGEEFTTLDPIYKITGEGECTLVVNDGKMVANIGQNLTIDTGRKLAYREDGTLSNTSVTGDYDNLILIEGRNKIEITDGFELKVIPNWRRL